MMGYFEFILTHDNGAQLLQDFIRELIDQEDYMSLKYAPTEFK